jgi:SpoVK/Ycf46/Vps4 family AAA+-type ATPase
MVVKNEGDALTAAAEAVRKMEPHARGTLVVFVGMTAAEAEGAARALAGGSELQKVNLSGVLSKYIGETEKNLRELFTRASASGVTLFFDEADALFGKRTEVKDSHDRYSNLKVSGLLDLLEGHRGITMFVAESSTPFVRARNRRRLIIVKGGGRGDDERPTARPNRR